MKGNVTSGQKMASLVRHAQGHHPEEEKWLFILFVNFVTKTLLVKEQNIKTLLVLHSSTS